jgi:hypothetical protein
LNLIESISSSESGFSIKLKSKLKAIELLLKFTDLKKPHNDEATISKVLNKVRELRE